MEQKITAIVHHMAKSHRELARILESKRDIVVRAAGLTTYIPSEHGATDGPEAVWEQSGAVAKSLTAYLNSLADLEEALAENLSTVVKELQASEDE